MNEYIATAVVIAVIISAGFFLLINFGIAEVAYFGIGIIILSIVISILYTWWKTSSDKTIESLKFETLSKIREEFSRTREDISQASNLVDISDIIRELKSLSDSLIKLGLYDEAFEKTGNKVSNYTLTSIEQHMRKTEQRLRSLETLTAGSYKPVLDAHLQSLLKNLSELEAAGFRIRQGIKEFEGLTARPMKSLMEMIDKETKVSELFSTLITQCTNEVESLLPLAKDYGDTAKADQDIQEAKKNRSNRDFCVPLLVRSRQTLKDILAQAFAKHRARLMGNVEKVLLTLVDEVSEYSKQMLEIRENIVSTNEPGRMNELLALETRFKGDLVNVIETLNGGLTRMEAEIVLHEPSPDFWNRDEGVKELVSKVDASKELDDFMKDAHAALTSVVKQYKKDVMFKKVLENYRKIEPIISKKLAEKGRLEESDINVRYADKFMHFFSSKHPDVEFRSHPPSLVSKTTVAAELKDKLRRR